MFGSALKTVLPEAMTDDDFSRVRNNRALGCEASAHRGLDTEDREEIRQSLDGVDVNRFVVFTGKVKSGRHHGSHVFEGVREISVIHKVHRRDRLVLQRLRQVRLP